MKKGSVRAVPFNLHTNEGPMRCQNTTKMVQLLRVPTHAFNFPIAGIDERAFCSLVVLWRSGAYTRHSLSFQPRLGALLGVWFGHQTNQGAPVAYRGLI